MSADQHKGHQMDVKEFEKQMEPKAKRSRLEPFQAQIFELKEKGYANWQICKYLEDNGITISQEGLRKFIKSRDGQPAPAAAPTTSGTTGLHNPKPTAEAAPAAQVAEVSEVEQQGLGDVLDAKKQEEKTNQYIKKSSNSLVNRNKK